ncbi:MAG: MATE family efflux transporter [Hyphomonadaceae bacterium]|nr:MATE family efflux transporter [Hyphomonadaceae bacterium]
MAARRSYIPDLARLAWPVALSRLGIMGMGLVDVVVVGQLAAHELPHQALGWAPTAVFLVTGIGLLTGVQVLAARAIGESEPAKAGEALRRGLVIAAVAGAVAVVISWLGGEALFTSFGIAPELARPSAAVMHVLALSVPLHLLFIAASLFMEAIQRPMPPTIIMWAANALNLALNLAWVPEHGAIGSAWATVGARLFLAAGLIAWVFLMKDAIRYGVRGQARSPDPNYRALLGVGAAAAVSQAAEAGAFSGMTIIAGRISADAVAGYQIMVNMLALVFMVALGFASAAAVLTAEAIGRAAPSDASRAGWTGVVMNAAAMFAAGVLMFAFAHPVARGYTADLALVALVAALVPLAAFVLTPDGAQVVLAAVLRARGDNWFPTASHILAYVVVMPPLAFWLAEIHAQGVGGLLWAIFWASVLSAAVLCARLLWLTRRLPSPAPAGEGS